ncbi:hypothetical protein GCM10027445_38110 [Amycolatopsis endophytica]|uniref:DUF6801 domain-containing protein n=1 Tax=Amycolatopsis endophytica TaxID=860233 RepID=A0A853B907_9PSEU|nr:DUF6801 domain-containing protein [Amycolatopsis endophytica]NYI90916.1 hypothetical protein [Amycolatopsis endophytica]
MTQARSRRAAVAALGLALAAAALVPATAAVATAATRAGTSTCQAGGSVGVPVSFRATFGETVAQGANVPVTDAAVTFVVPPDAVDALRDSGGATVDASAAVELSVAQPRGTQKLTVTGLSTSEIPLPADGELRITLPGHVPPIVAGAGPVTVSLTSLAPRLVVHGETLNADLGCTTDPAANGELAQVRVSAPTASPVPSVPDATEIAAAVEDTPLLTAKFLVDGTSRIAKMGSDLVLQQGTFDAGLFTGDVPNTIRIEGDLNLPKSESYFVAFRFMPVTSDVRLPQAEKATGTADISGGLFTPTIDMTVRVNLLVSNVKQDGVPLAVGENCRTVSPLVIPMKGQTSLVPGSQSTIESSYEIPPFTGCGVTEDLDPLLTGLISGPGNTMRTTLTAQGIG